MLAGVKMRSVEPDELYRMQGEQLRLMVEEDLKNGLIPFHVRTVTCSELQNFPLPKETQTLQYTIC
jgi:hypothetical protein